MDIHSPSELLIDQIRDLYNAESQVVGTMPELAVAATNEALHDLLERQEGISLDQKHRLKEAAELLGESPEGDICKAMKGLIDGGNKHIEKATEDRTRNLILVAHVNRIYHYEIAGYGFATALSKQLGREEVTALLSQSLQEEKAGASVLAQTAVEIFSEVDEKEPC